MARLTQLQQLNSKWEFVINETNQEKLDLMKGREAQSLIYANCVYINNKGQVMDGGRGGKVLDTLNTNDKISKLWKEFFLNEMDYNL